MEKNLKTVTNQKVVTIHKTEQDKSNVYSKLSVAATRQAFQTLSSAGIALYIYLDMNQNNYQFGLSRVAVMEYCNISKNTYIKAVNELIEHGYLVPLSEQSNRYTFYENPNDTQGIDTQQTKTTEKKQSKKQITKSNYTPSKDDHRILNDYKKILESGDMDIDGLLEVVEKYNGKDFAEWVLYQLQ